MRGCKFVVCRNLSTNVEEDELWEFFLPCMSICRTKLVLDAATGASKGVAYGIELSHYVTAARCDHGRKKGEPEEIARELLEQA